MIKSLIKSINNIKMESSLNVCDAIINVIDKNDILMEYDEYSVFDDIIMESMMIFMESKNRVRDRTPRNDISKWMDENGLWYTGNNPHKKKLSNNIYHFLKQHDFRPSDETYASSIKNKDGTNKRLKLKLDINGKIRLSEKEKNIIERWKKYYLKKNSNGKYSFDWNRIRENAFDDKNSAEADLMDLMQNLEILHGGSNAFYDNGRDEIFLSIDTLKGKQTNAQIMFKHEEGHAYDMKHSEKSKEEQEEIDKIKKDSTEHKKEASEKGLKSNCHDMRDHESFADSYAVKNAKIRTKKNSTRNINEKDLLKHFEVMDKYLQDKHVAETIDDCITNINKAIENCDNFINNKSMAYIDLTDRVTRIAGTVERIQEKQQKVNIELSLLGKSNDELRELEKKLHDDLKRLNDSRAPRKEIEYIDDTIEKIEDFLDGFKPSDVEEHKKSLEKSLKRNKEMELKRLESSTNKPFLGKGGFEAAANNNSGKPVMSLNNKDINEIISKAKSSNEAYDMIYSKITPAIKRIREKLKNTKSGLEELKKTNNKIKDTSTRVRYEFAKKFIKEYFDEFFGDFELYVE